MGDAMISARMPQAKKDAGGRVLEQLGINVSQFINSAYDYLIQHGSSPFEQPAGDERCETELPERLAQALVQVEGMCLPESNRFATMTDGDIRQERLARQGFEAR